MTTKHRTTDGEKKLDLNYQRECGWLHRMVIRLFAKHINRVAVKAMARAYERTHIDSFQLHEMTGSLNRMLWPKINDFNVTEPDNALR
jgi:hypothetical protein